MRVNLHNSLRGRYSHESQLSRRDGSMTEVSVVAPDGGEAIQLGPIQMRILEDGRTTGHRLGVGEITIPPGTAGRPRHPPAPPAGGLSLGSGNPPVPGGGTWSAPPPGPLEMAPPGAPPTLANPAQAPVLLVTTF